MRGVDSSGQRAAIREGEAVYFDAIQGVSGTEYPIGTPNMPVSNVADLRAICAARHLRTIVVVDGNLVLDAAMQSYHFIGFGRKKYLATGFTQRVNLNGQDVTGSTFRDLWINGEQAGANPHFERCFLDNTSSLQSESVFNCLLDYTEIRDGSSIFYDCMFQSVIDTLGVGGVTIYRGSGDLEIDTHAAGSVSDVHMVNGVLTIDGTCNGGTINLYGDFTLINHAAAGCTVNDYRVGGRQGHSKDQWCATPIASLAIPAAAADLTFADVVFPADFLPAGAVIESVQLMLKWRKQVDSSAAPNAINGANHTIRIKKSTGAWGVDDVIGIMFADNQLATDASATEGGDMIVGSYDVDSEVDDTDGITYNVRSEETNRGDAIHVDGASLTLYDVYTGLRVYYTTGGG